MKIRLDHPLWRRWAPGLARSLVAGYLCTCRSRFVVSPETKDLMVSGRPVLYALWHCHLLLPLYASRQYLSHLPPLVVMASPSRDGEFIAEVARGLGVLVCPGSRRKGGMQALKHMAAFMRRGHSGGLIADGSRGPARVAQKGIVFLAREAQAPILPLAVAASHKVALNSWDRFELPLPFSQIAVLVGDPLWVPAATRGPALEALRRELETRLNALYHQSQNFFSQ